MHWVGIEIGIVVMASIKPQRSADVFEIPTVSYPSNSSIYGYTAYDCLNIRTQSNDMTWCLF